MTDFADQGSRPSAPWKPTALGGVLAAAWALAPLASLAAPQNETVITIDYQETHDRLDPDPRSGFLRDVEIEATLSPNGGMHDNFRKVWRGRKHRTEEAEKEHDEKLGDASSRVVWRVEGPHELQRLEVGRQFIVVVNVTIEPDGKCSVDVKYDLQKGYTDVIFRRRSTGELARFSLPKVLSSSCSIK